MNFSNLRISKDTVIYVVAPAKEATGGPELLHQLAYHLRVDLGHEAFMYYYPPDIKDPVHPEYTCYGNPFVREIIDSHKNILVVPEVIWGIRILNRFVNIQKAIWWLSVDNFLTSYLLSNECGLTSKLLFLTLMKKLIREVGCSSMANINSLVIDRLLKDKRVFRIIVDEAFRKFKIKEVQLHLCQSYYAMNFVESMGIRNVTYLSDYLNREFLVEGFQPNLKENIVAFNPKKGFSFTHKIIAAAKDVTFIPIENMTRRDVINLLKKAKVYIDFGNHPGKDRIPREAAILGCCVIVGKRGSAANSNDVPIPERYKFEVNETAIPQIVQAIKYCIKNYSQAYLDFDVYRELIRQEPKVFLRDLQRIFSIKERPDPSP